MTNVSDDWEPYEEWTASQQAMGLDLNVADWTIDPKNPLFPAMAEVARMKCDRAGASYNCLIGIVGKVYTKQRVWVGQRSDDKRWVMRYTHLRRRIERDLTSDEIEIVESFDGPEGAARPTPPTPSKAVRVRLNLTDGSWRYAPKSSQGAHDLDRNGVPQNRRGRERTGDSTVPKEVRDRMRRQVQEQLAEQRWEDELARVRKAWRAV